MKRGEGLFLNSIPAGGLQIEDRSQSREIRLVPDRRDTKERSRVEPPYQEGKVIGNM